MTTILIERGEKTAKCWRYLRENNVEFSSGRHYPPDGGEVYNMFFDIVDEKIAVECVLRFG